MKLSIITINYNNSMGLKKTIESVITQTCKDFEWIIIDGGSSDGSKELIEQYQEHLTYWCSEPDKGIYNAMNKGVRYANGDYCLFLNSGDVLCASGIMEHVSEIPFQAEIVSFDMYVDSKTRKGYRKSPDVVNAYWLYDHYIPHPATWIKRELLQRLPYDESYKLISDWIFFFDALVLHECSYQHVPMAISIFYRDGMSNNPENIKIIRDEGARYLPTRFIKKYIEDKDNPVSFHYMSVQVANMEPVCQKIMRCFLRLMSYVDLQLVKPFMKNN